MQVDHDRTNVDPPYTFALFHMKPPLYGLKPIFKRCKNDHLMYISRLLLMRSSDCELNPGPRTRKYPCRYVVRHADGDNVQLLAITAISGTM